MSEIYEKKGPILSYFHPKTAAKLEGRSLIIYKSYKLGSIKLKNEIPKGITCDFQIRYNNRLDVWHIITSEEIKNKVSDNNSSKTIVIDPGVRTFLTCLDSDGMISEIGKDWNLNEKIKKRMESITTLKGNEVVRDLMP